MSARRGPRPSARSQLVTGTLINDDSKAMSRLLSDIAAAHTDLERRVSPRAQFTVDLVVGNNRISHGLGRKATGATVSPTVADATFAWSFAVDGDAQVVITVINVAQPNAAVEIW